MNANPTRRKSRSTSKQAATSTHTPATMRASDRVFDIIQEVEEVRTSATDLLVMLTVQGGGHSVGTIREARDVLAGLRDVERELSELIRQLQTGKAIGGSP
jgi:hypothetical protein